MFVSLVFSIINVLVNFPILLNIIVDIVLTACIIPRVFSFFDAIPGTGNLDWCQPQRRYPSPEPIPPHPRCEDWKLIVKIVMGIATGFGGIVGYVLFLTVTRLISSSSLVKKKTTCIFYLKLLLIEPQALRIGYWLTVQIVLFMWLCWCFASSRCSEPNFGRDRSPWLSQRGKSPWRLVWNFWNRKILGISRVWNKALMQVNVDPCTCRRRRSPRTCRVILS